MKEDAVPAYYAEAYTVYSLIKDGLLAPFSLSALDELPSDLVGRIQALSSVIQEIREANRGTTP